MGKNHVFLTHETPKYMSQACDAKSSSLWLVEIRVTRRTKQLANSWHIRAALILISQSLPSVNTPPTWLRFVQSDCLNCLGHLWIVYNTVDEPLLLAIPMIYTPTPSTLWMNSYSCKLVECIFGLDIFLEKKTQITCNLKPLNMPLYKNQCYY